MAKAIYLENENVIELDGLINSIGGSYINNAVVEVTVEDTAGTDVAGVTWPISMAYVASSNGKYRATLPDTLALTPGAVYHAVITAVSGSVNGKWILELYATERIA